MKKIYIIIQNITSLLIRPFDMKQLDTNTTVKSLQEYLSTF